MDYTSLEGTDLTVSRLCLGGWQIGGMAFGYMPDDDVAAIVTTALDLGITFFDVAPSYGRFRAEDLIGRLLPPREDVVVATKVGLSWGEDLAVYPDLSPIAIRVGIEQSLRRLRRDTIDLCLVHFPDPSTPLDESYEALEALRASGKIRHIGVCNYRADDLREIVKLADVRALQARYNWLEQENASDIRFCREQGISFLAHSALATGLLTGKYEREIAFKDARNRFDLYRGERLRAALARVAELKVAAAAQGKSVLGAALDFILDSPGVQAAIIGTRSPEQLTGAVRAVYS